MFYTIEETRAALKSGKTTSEQLVRGAIETFEKDKIEFDINWRNKIIEAIV